MRAILAPLLAVLILLTGLAAGLSQGAMLRADAAPAWLDLCGGDDGAGAGDPCLDCTLGAAMATAEVPALPRAARAVCEQAGGHLVAAQCCVVGGGARAPPGWV